MKKLLFLITVFAFIISGCAKMPEQIRNAKAFSDKGYIVQDNLKYEIKEYNFGRVVASEVVESGTYYNVLLEVSNIGKKKDKIPFEQIKLETQKGNLKLDMDLIKKANKNGFIDAEIQPEGKVNAWLVFPAEKMPTKAKLYIKESAIEIE